MSQKVTGYLVFVVISILMGAFQYGYHNGELNTPQDIISKCANPTFREGFLPPCIPMPDSQYSLVVSVLTAGGLLGALSAPFFNDRYGRRSTLFGTNLLLSSGSLITTLASTPERMMIGRFLSGIGSGIVTVVVPAYLAECVPKSKRGFFGALNQLAIVMGIMAAQVISLAWSTISSWRYILVMGVVLAILQCCLLPFCVESPRYLALIPGGFNRAKKSLVRLRGTSVDQAEEEINEWRREWASNAQNQAAEAELDEEENFQDDQRLIQSTASNTQHVNVWTFLGSSKYRRPLMIVLLLQLFQQLSGINAVIFYSTSIMSSVFPESSGLITVYISIVNLIMTSISAYLMDKLGRRPLFLFSGLFMALMSCLLGWSIETGHNTTSAFAILAYVALFAVGLGPIPFLMIPELVDTQAVSSACSVGLASNMIANFAVSSGFFILRNFMGQGYVFYLFAVISLLLAYIAFFILPETKGRSAEDVIRSGYSIYPCHYESF
ncbi:general substrate transporter [Gilbertella persicaria]|uniref:general substrate transporter n=1 Tax=Gilbertella persicaria TaxID=101096 RepID=UPI00221E37DC|nr:general substrate transporter [Gilbertella persicaria]KAI8058669.1 general substrate transporter [Gilbertella persicaria]